MLSCRCLSGACMTQVAPLGSVVTDLCNSGVGFLQRGEIRVFDLKGGHLKHHFGDRRVAMEHSTAAMVAKKKGETERREWGGGKTGLRREAFYLNG